MMRRILAFAAAALAAATLSSCSQSEVDASFLEDYGVCLKVDGKMVHVFDELTWQLSYNPSSKTFRAHSDTMSDYFSLKCSSLPTTVGQSLTGSLEWSTSSDIKTRSGLDFTVEQMDSDGNVWLWCSKKDIGVCVRTLD